MGELLAGGGCVVLIIDSDVQGRVHNSIGD